jgi:mono/diheme cytochrome c family protein
MRCAIGFLILIAPSLLAQMAPDPAVFARVPEKIRPKRNPLAGDMKAPIAGGKLFRQHCAQCHGATAQGGEKVPALVNAEMQNVTAGQIFWVITNGVVRRGMPSWSKLPEAQRWQIVAFLMELNGQPGTP